MDLYPICAVARKTDADLIAALGAVQGGRILTDQPLAEFEGKKVSVTVINRG